MGKDFQARLTSRKFLLTLGSFITLIALQQYTEAVAVVMGFLGIEGLIDFKSTGLNVEPYSEPEEPAA